MPPILPQSSRRCAALRHRQNRHPRRPLARPLRGPGPGPPAAGRSLIFRKMEARRCRLNSKSRNCAPSFPGATTQPNGVRSKPSYAPPKDAGSGTIERREKLRRRAGNRPVRDRRGRFGERRPHGVAPPFLRAGRRENGPGVTRRGRWGRKARKARWKATAPPGCRNYLSAHHFWAFRDSAALSITVPSRRKSAVFRSIWRHRFSWAASARMIAFSLPP